MYEMLVGLDVSDNEVYAQYRAGIKPMLEKYQGAFGFDFMVSEVLLSQVDVEINRVFTLNFPTQAQADSFFADPDYQAVKSEHFVKSVRHVTRIACYEKIV